MPLRVAQGERSLSVKQEAALQRHGWDIGRALKQDFVFLPLPCQQRVPCAGVSCTEPGLLEGRIVFTQETSEQDGLAAAVWHAGLAGPSTRESSLHRLPLAAAELWLPQSEGVKTDVCLLPAGTPYTYIGHRPCLPVQGEHDFRQRVSFSCI